MIGKCRRRHPHQEFVRFLAEIDAAVPHEDGVTVHLILDSYATHKTPAVRRWLAKRPRFVVHFTPTSASWLNQVERFFAEITQKRLRRGVFRSVRELERAIEAYLAEHNRDPKPFRWTATADLILRRVEGVCTRTCTQETSPSLNWRWPERREPGLPMRIDITADVGFYRDGYLATPL